MICYKDMAFCPFWKECAESYDCFRRADDKIVKGAETMKLPLCLFTEKPECFKDKEDARLP